MKTKSKTTVLFAAIAATAAISVAAPLPEEQQQAAWQRQRMQQFHNRTEPLNERPWQSQQRQFMRRQDLGYAQRVPQFQGRQMPQRFAQRPDDLQGRQRPWQIQQRQFSPQQRQFQRFPRRGDARQVPQYPAPRMNRRFDQRQGYAQQSPQRRQQFLRKMRQRRQINPEQWQQRKQQILRKFDADGDGRLSVEERTEAKEAVKNLIKKRRDAKGRPGPQAPATEAVPKPAPSDAAPETTEQ